LKQNRDFTTTCAPWRRTSAVAAAGGGVKPIQASETSTTRMRGRYFHLASCRTVHFILFSWQWQWQWQWQYTSPELCIHRCSSVLPSPVTTGISTLEPTWPANTRQLEISLHQQFHVVPSKRTATTFDLHSRHASSCLVLPEDLSIPMYFYPQSVHNEPIRATMSPRSLWVRAVRMVLVRNLAPNLGREDPQFSICCFSPFKTAWLH
jgi:hypothetical protein